MEIRVKKFVALVQGSEKSAGWYSRHLVFGIGFYRKATLIGYPWPHGQHNRAQTLRSKFDSREGRIRNSQSYQIL